MSRVQGKEEAVSGNGAEWESSEGRQVIVEEMGRRSWPPEREL